ncbi:MAG TPA: ABC transporter substrate-binding protein [Micromonosporaceae bacterium]|nr:ABC transporter substrate-binding protein [Micromonosporaceae bacterium]
MRGKTLKVAVVATAAAMFATACGGGGSSSDGDKSGGVLRVYNAEPAFLVPTAGDDEPSIYVIRQLYRGLVRYNQDGAPENDLAESIESSDQKLWTIKLKSGYKFDNDEPVDADAFIRAWNYAAYSPNAQNNGPFMSRIVGYEDVTSEDPDGDGPEKAPEPKAKEMSGLKKVDDLTFTVELTAPFSGFPTTIGYSGFFPVAKACLDDFAACNEAPIGNGPYKIEGKWQHDVGITLARSDSYGGKDKGKPDKIEYKIFADIGAAYAAFQSGELDVMYTIPPERFKEAKATYGDRMFELAGDSYTYLGLPTYVESLKDKRIRQALSLAIDRQSIIDAVYDGRFIPATGAVAPGFDGARENACQYCKQDVDKAKALLAEAGGWKGGKVALWANAGAGHDKWLQAVGDQWKQHLGIDYELKVNLQFAEYLDTADQGKFTGPYRLGWGPDYPFLETFLAPLYRTASSSNNSKYTNPAFDELLAKGDAASSLEEAIKFYQEAEDIILEELPAIPMWWKKEAAIYSENVENFVWNPVSDASYGEMTMKQKN